MQLELGVHVFSHDNHDIGTVKYLIMDPESRQVTTAVVEKGFFLPHDIEVPLSAFETADPKEAHISFTSEQVKELSHFDQSKYRGVPEEHLTVFPTFFAGGLLWPDFPTPPATPGIPPTTLPFLVNAPDADSETLPSPAHPEPISIAIGSDVIGRDGKKLGEVHNVIVDTETGLPSRIVLHRGLILTQHVELPASTIRSIADGVVQLNLDESQLDAEPQDLDLPLF